MKIWKNLQNYTGIGRDPVTHSLQKELNSTTNDMVFDAYQTVKNCHNAVFYTRNDLNLIQKKIENFDFTKPLQKLYDLNAREKHESADFLKAHAEYLKAVEHYKSFGKTFHPYPLAQWKSKLLSGQIKPLSILLAISGALYTMWHSTKTSPTNDV